MEIGVKGLLTYYGVSALAYIAICQFLMAYVQKPLRSMILTSIDGLASGEKKDWVKNSLIKVEKRVVMAFSAISILMLTLIIPHIISIIGK